MKPDRYSRAAQRAASQLMRKGLDCARDLRSEEALVWLADIARYIGTCDPTMIGAAALLESSGHERAQMTLVVG